MFKLALVQMRVESGQKESNLRRAEIFIREAAVSGAQVVLLPEALTLGWTDPSAKHGADEIPGGAAFAHLQAAARENGVYLCAGFIERAGEKVFNSALFFDPKGGLLLHHRKLNELAIAHDVYALGDRLQVADTPLGRFGVMICADGFAPGQVISRALGMMGADMILSPSAWAVPADHDNQTNPYGARWIENYCPVARDFRMWIAGASNVGWITSGPWHGRKCIGCSLLVDASGQPVVRGPYGVDAETILYANVRLEPRPAQGDAWEAYWKSQNP